MIIRLRFCNILGILKKFYREITKNGREIRMLKKVNNWVGTLNGVVIIGLLINWSSNPY